MHAIKKDRLFFIHATTISYGIRNLSGILSEFQDYQDIFKNENAYIFLNIIFMIIQFIFKKKLNH